MRYVAVLAGPLLASAVVAYACGWLWEYKRWPLKDAVTIDPVDRELTRAKSEAMLLYALQ